MMSKVVVLMIFGAVAATASENGSTWAETARANSNSDDVDAAQLFATLAGHTVRVHFVEPILGYDYFLGWLKYIDDDYVIVKGDEPEDLLVVLRREDVRVIEQVHSIIGGQNVGAKGTEVISGWHKQSD